MPKSALDNIHSLQFMHVVGTAGDKQTPQKNGITIVSLNCCCWRYSCGNLNIHMTSPPRACIKSTVNLIAYGCVEYSSTSMGWNTETMMVPNKCHKGSFPI